MRGDLPFRLRQTTDHEKWRADTFWTKEPETIAWIESFKDGDTLLDVGANIGLYSLYAAKLGHQTVAVEPHPSNFTALTMNTRQLNRSLPVRAVYACVGHCSQMTDFQYDAHDAGTTGGGYTRMMPISVPIYCYTVDELMGLYCGPYDHIKVDVDGEEREIVLGMRESLGKQVFKSCLIEIEPKHRDFVIGQFTVNGYSSISPFNAMTPHSRTRRAREGIKVENIVFTRF